MANAWRRPARIEQRTCGTRSDPGIWCSYPCPSFCERNGMILRRRIGGRAFPQSNLLVLYELFEPQRDQLCLVSFRVQENHERVAAMYAQQVVFANGGAQKRYQCAQHAACKLLLVRRKVIGPLVWQLADAKDDHAPGVADAPQFALLVLDGFGRSDRLPDMVRAIALHVGRSEERRVGKEC